MIFKFSVVDLGGIFKQISKFLIPKFDIITFSSWTNLSGSELKYKIFESNQFDFKLFRFGTNFIQIIVNINLQGFYLCENLRLKNLL